MPPIADTVAAMSTPDDNSLGAARAPRRVRLARPAYNEADIELVSEVLRSGMLVSGPRVRAFEQVIADRVGRKHALAVSNGSAALELALRAVGIGTGDDVIVPNLTWPSPAHAVCLAGASPVLVDVDANEWNATAKAYVDALSPITRAAIVIDQFGVPARHDAIRAALPDRVTIIEDAACAIGSQTGGKECGTFGTISTLSFHPRKVVTTGEGGMCLTDDASLAHKLSVYRNHGQRVPGEFETFGANERLTEFAAALGIGQIQRLETIIAQRTRHAARYHDALRNFGVMQSAPTGSRVNNQTFGIVFRTLDERNAATSALEAAGVEAGRLSYALDQLPSLTHARRVGDLEVSHAIVEHGIALPLHNSLSDDDLELVISTLSRALT